MGYGVCGIDVVLFVFQCRSCYWNWGVGNEDRVIEFWWLALQQCLLTEILSSNILEPYGSCESQIIKV